MEYFNLISHPSFILFLSTIGLIIFFKQDRIFKLIVYIAPFLSCLLLNYSSEKFYITIEHISLIYEKSYTNIYICWVFNAAIFLANLFALSRNKKIEIIFGNLYGASSIACVLAGDYISIFISLELMMIFSSIIIFIGYNSKSSSSAKKYFLTHFFSGNMILFGFIYLINKTNSIEIINISELMNDAQYSSLALMSILIGMLINIAVFPFSGWMVNYYSKASPTGFLYLISFTTKASIVLLIKLFAGYEALKYVAAVMIIYACLKMIFENNVLRYLSYLSINAMGFMLLGISNGSKPVIYALFIYLGIHILYKLILSICLIDISNKKLELTSVNKPNTFFINIGFFISIILLLNVPGTLTFSAKTIITQEYGDSIIYLLINISTFIVAYSIPWKYLFRNNNQLPNQANMWLKRSGLIVGIILFMVISIYASKMIIASEQDTLFYHTIKQIVILSFAILLSYIFTPKRFATKSINLIEVIGKCFFYCLNYFESQKKEDLVENWSFTSLEHQIKKRVHLFHNQQTAIFIFILVFIILLLNALFFG